MFAEPLSVTYNASAKALSRVSASSRRGIAQAKGTSTFRTADDQFSVIISEYLMGGNIRRFEVILERVEVAGPDPFAESWVYLPNRVGLVFEVNDLKYNTTTDLPLLQDAILALVNGPFRARLIAGEK